MADEDGWVNGVALKIRMKDNVDYHLGQLN